jgi:uncharacterized protein (TIGR00730 family)
LDVEEAFMNDDAPFRSVVCENAETIAIVEQALHGLWSAVNRLSQIKPPKHERFTVTVFGSARVKPGDALYREVEELSRVLAELGCDIVTGGGPGLMEAANQGAQQGDPNDRSRSVGVRIALPFEQGANAFVELLYTHETFFTRLQHFVRLSNAFVVMDGGIGTTLELFLVWQLLQVRHVTDVPLILVGKMWRELHGWAERHLPERFAAPADVNIPICVDTAAQAVELLRPHIDKFKGT